ncbi:MAG: hypothetical protein LAO78_28095 [Acidobacteriia bacterium]|nr:hypothetical protein [Terriglobia bacterium]
MSQLFRRSLNFAAGFGALCAIISLVGCTQTTSITVSTNTMTGTTVSATYTATWDPPGSYLVNFDASQALLNISLSNATVTANTGTVTVSVKDLTTGQIVGQQNFNYVINGTSVYAQNPSAVYNWLQQFTGYSSIDVITNLTTPLQSITDAPSSVTGSVQYQGTTYASASAGWEPSDTCGTDNGGINQREICPQ